jgi:hypothetical protein
MLSAHIPDDSRSSVLPTSGELNNLGVAITELTAELEKQVLVRKEKQADVDKKKGWVAQMREAGTFGEAPQLLAGEIDKAEAEWRKEKDKEIALTRQLTPMQDKWDEWAARLNEEKAARDRAAQEREAREKEVREKAAQEKTVAERVSSDLLISIFFDFIYSTFSGCQEEGRYADSGGIPEEEKGDLVRVRA